MHIRSFLLALVVAQVLLMPLRAGTVYVDAAATGNGSGTDWTNAMTDLTQGLAAAQAGDEVWVAAATYVVGPDPIQLKDDVKIIGGFAGWESNAFQARPAANPTYLSGDNQYRPLESIDNNNSAILEGFYITAGKAYGPSGGNVDYGAAMKLKNSAAVIRWCVFTGNNADAIGGAVTIWGGTPTFENCTFHDNDGGWGAGAVYNRDAGAPTFRNCLFYDNTAWEGGAVVTSNGAVKFINCTFTNNSASVGRGGAIVDTRGEATLRNCVLWGNTAAKVGPDIHNDPTSGGTTTVTYSNVEQGWPGTGNLAGGTDPTFLNSATGHFQLMAGSPCIDMGSASDSGAGQTDIDGQPRKVGDYIDMGADEFADCNATGLVDLCDIDCTAAGDACNVSGCGVSGDCNGNNVPDECETCTVAAAPSAEPGGVAKNRYLSFVAGSPGRQTAIRVTLTSLPAPFDSFNGTTMWVAAPEDVCENSGQVAPPCTPTFKAARLSCDPVYLDGGTLGVVHVFDDEIVPGASYDIQAIDCLCDSAAETDYSPSLTVQTSALWGDITGDCSVTPCTPPDGIVDIVDSSAVVDKFENDPGAVIKARADVDPDVPDRLVDVGDVTRVQDAASGASYPFDGPTACSGGGGPPPGGGFE